MVRPAIVMGAWTLAGLLLATQAWVSGAFRGEPIAWTHSFAIWFAWACIWALLTPVAIALARRFPIARPRLAQTAIVHGVAGIVLAASNLALFAIIAPQVGAVNAGPDWYATFSRLLGTTFLLNVPVYWLVIGAIHAAHLARAAREREGRALRLEAQLSEARLLALRAQLQPHFLFNALNTVSVLMREDVDTADRILVLLSGLLRRALEASSVSEVALREELAFVEAYLAIEQARFDERFSYRIDIDPQLPDARVPSLILQPLVENAVRHGLSASTSPGRVEIAATCGDGMLHLTVRDNGVGISSDAIDGVGLSNTRSRLRLLYGDAHAFELKAAQGGGVLVSLAIPLLAPLQSEQQP